LIFIWHIVWTESLNEQLQLSITLLSESLDRAELFAELINLLIRGQLIISRWLHVGQEEKLVAVELDLLAESAED